MARPSRSERTGAPRRRLARLAAVQALYQIEVTGRPAVRVVEEFELVRLADVLESVEEESPVSPADTAWFAKVTLGAWTIHDRLDPEIARHLAPGWTLERAGYLFRACLRAGAYELVECPDVPIGVIISEYVEVAHALLPGTEPGVVHAVLDRLGRVYRPKPDAA